ncbi:MAG: AMP-binding protein, partial [bacterium]|nr:AMP-binding protein [bacterium]
MAAYIKTGAQERYASVQPVEKREYYALSSAQKRLFILQRMDEQSVSYNMPQQYPVTPEIDKEYLETLFKKIIHRHESLRTSFHMIDDTPVQKIRTPGRVEFSIRHYEAVAEIKTELSGFFGPFDLTRPPLLRVALLELKSGEKMLHLDMHHIISDGTSQALLIEEFRTLAAGDNMPPLRLQYKDYALWQNSETRQPVVKAQAEYWKNCYSGELPVLELPLDYPRPTMQSSEGKTIRFQLQEIETKGIKEIARENNVTLFMVIFSAYAILMSKLSGQEDVIIGTPTAGRRHADLEKIIGLFVNTLAILSQPARAKTIREYLREVKEHTLAAFENQEYPFEELVDSLSLRRDTGRSPLFDVMINMINITAAGTPPAGGKKHAARAAESPAHREETAIENRDRQQQETAAKFDMTLTAREHGNTTAFGIRYCTKLFKEETVNRIIGYFKKILQTLTAKPGGRIGDIEIIPETIKKEKLATFNQDLRDHTVTSPIQDKLERSIAKNPDAIAVRYGTKEITYRELGGKVASITRWIVKNNTPKGSYIGIYMRNKMEIIAAMMGMLNAGCVFITLDTMLPVKRLETMIQLTGTRLMFTEGENQKNAAEIGKENRSAIQRKTVDETFYRENPPQTTAGNKITYQMEDNIYIFFSSGTTGKPKAITGKNKSLLQFIQWEIDTFDITPAFRVSQLAAVGFDALLRDVFTTLCAGATVCIPGNADIIGDSDELINWIDGSAITLIHCVPGIFRVFNKPELTAAHFHSLKYILLAGEALNTHELQNWHDTMGKGIQLVNLYGPTEATMVRTAHYITAEDLAQNSIPIGEPIRATRIILLDKSKHVCDRGLVGEIYIRTPY